MAAWALILKVFTSLRGAFPREASCMWFQAAVIGLIIRPDDGGVTAVVRGLGLGERAYESVIKHFSRVSCDMGTLARLWTVAVLSMADQKLYRVNGRSVIVADSTKGAKTGRRMPGV